MANFCRQCSIDMFGRDFKELAGDTTEEQTKHGIVANVICEGCGFIQVNHLGECVTKNCLCNGHENYTLLYEVGNPEVSNAVDGT